MQTPRGVRVERPIVVACIGRSGSSLLTGVLKSHGAWTGRCLGPDERRNPRGYFENVRVKKEAERRVPRPRIADVHAPLDGWRDFVLGVLDEEGYAGGPWVMKHFVGFWKSWETLDPIWLLPRRDTEDILRSVRRAGFWKWASDARLREIFDRHQRELDFIRNERGGVEVFSDQVIAGDRSSLRRAVTHAGLDYDDGVAREFVKPSFWGRAEK